MYISKNFSFSSWKIGEMKLPFEFIIYLNFFWKWFFFNHLCLNFIHFKKSKIKKKKFFFLSLLNSGVGSFFICNKNFHYENLKK